MNALFEGVLTGVVLAALIGPSFFYLIRISLINGFGAAVQFAVGIILSDLVLITALTFGMGQLLQSQLFQQVFALTAGLLLVILGALWFWKPVENNNPEGMKKSGRLPF